ncbi:hypothetical protein ACFYWY_04900 [Streptomyces sp. NPDC002870]|uniref:hypothetical protein n=1 Tax=Streptomyces sp. NPDC002870 TaxID=3364666 RepID=UPI00367EC5BC
MDTHKGFHAAAVVTTTGALLDGRTFPTTREGYRLLLSWARSARMRWDTRTRTYVERRVTAGKTRREAIRCLKRYVAREIYQTIVTLRPASEQRSAS